MEWRGKEKKMGKVEGKRRQNKQTNKIKTQRNKERKVNGKGKREKWI